MKVSERRLQEFIMFVISGIAVSAVIFVIFCVQPARAQDTYNFYFQKGSAVGTPSPIAPTSNGLPTQNAPATDGAPTQSVPTDDKTKTNSTQPAATSAAEASIAKADKDYSKWWLTLGAARYGYSSEKQIRPESYGRTDAMDTGPRIEAGYNINRYVGIGLGFAYVKPVGDYKVFEGSTSQIAHTHFEELQTDLLLTLTPIRINAFGWDFITVSLIGGALGANTKKVEFSGHANCSNITDDKQYRGDCALQANRKFAFVGQYGLRAGINISRNVGIVADYRVLVHGEEVVPRSASVATAGLNFVF